MTASRGQGHTTTPPIGRARHARRHLAGLGRGVRTDEFLIKLGADLDELAARTPCREPRAPAGQPGRPSPQLNRAMYGTCGEWTYVLDRFSPPAVIIHAPDACAYRADFGTDTGQGTRRRI